MSPKIFVIFEPVTINKFPYNRDDIRIGQGPILMSLGIPISLSPDDPGKFGY